MFWESLVTLSPWEQLFLSATAGKLMFYLCQDMVVVGSVRNRVEGLN